MEKRPMLQKPHVKKYKKALHNEVKRLNPLFCLPYRNQIYIIPVISLVCFLPVVKQVPHGNLPLILCRSLCSVFPDFGCFSPLI